MQIKIKIENGKVTNGQDKIKDVFSSCANGTYLLSLRSLDSLSSPRDYQSSYFAMVDVIGVHAGEKRYDLHEMFKQDAKVETTKNTTSEEWIEIIKKFRWWAFDKYECIV